MARQGKVFGEPTNPKNRTVGQMSRKRRSRKKSSRTVLFRLTQHNTSSTFRCTIFCLWKKAAFSRDVPSSQMKLGSFKRSKPTSWRENERDESRILFKDTWICEKSETEKETVNKGFQTHSVRWSQNRYTHTPLSVCSAETHEIDLYLKVNFETSVSRIKRNILIWGHNSNSGKQKTLKYRVAQFSFVPIHILLNAERENADAAKTTHTLKPVYGRGGKLSWPVITKEHK